MNSTGGSEPTFSKQPIDPAQARQALLAGRRMGKSALVYEIIKARIEAGESDWLIMDPSDTVPCIGVCK